MTRADDSRKLRGGQGQESVSQLFICERGFAMQHRKLAPMPLLALVLLAGCSSQPLPSPSPSPSPLPTTQVCETQVVGQDVDGASVIRCRKLYADPPLVRMPADTTPTGDGAITVYGTISGSLEGPPQLRLADRTGTQYDLDDATGAAADGSTPFVADNKLLSNRINVIVYRVVGTRHGSAIHVESVTPVVLVEGRAIDEHLLGAWEGTLSRRQQDGTWAWNDSTQDVPFRFVIDRLDAMEAMPEVGDATKPLADAPRFRAVGHIENADTPTMLSTGACAPSLASYGDENPIHGATSPEFGLWRQTMMHTPASDEFNLVNDYPKGISLDGATGMSGAAAYALPSLLRSDRAEGQLVFYIHGTPIGFLVIKMSRVQGGGGSCTP